MKNIFFLSISLFAFSMWAVAKTPAPQQTPATTQTVQLYATYMEQPNPSGPNPMAVSFIDQPAETAISVYPNPAINYLDIKFTSGIESKVEITLYDVTGKLIKSVTEMPVADKAIRITRDNLPSGVYFLLVKTPAGQQCRKVIFS